MLSDLYSQKMRTSANGGFRKKLAITTAGTTQDVLAPKVAGLTLVIQKWKISVQVAAAVTWQLNAKTTTAQKFSPSLDMNVIGAVYSADYGSGGVALPAGETLQLTISGANASGTVEVEGYYA